jgi:PAS domain S-box-containing protein
MDLQQENKTLKQHVSHYEAVFDHLEQGIYIANAANQVEYVNARLADILGLSLDELRTQSHPILMNSSETPQEILHIRPDGQSIWCKIVVKPVYQGQMVIVSEITERKQIEEVLTKQRDFTESILSTAGSLIIVLDRYGRIIRFNGACERLTGYRAEELLGEYFWDHVIPPENVDAIQGAFHDLLMANQLPRNLRNEWVTRTGERRLLSWANNVLRNSNGEIDYVIGTAVDITEQSRTEQMLRRRLSLEQALSQVLNELVTGKDVAQDITRSLETLARFVDADRGVIFSLLDESDSLMKIYEWRADDAVPGYPLKVPFPAEAYQPYLNRLNGLQHIIINRFEDAVPDRMILDEEHFQAMFYLPLIWEHHTHGILLFMLYPGHQWDESVVPLFRFVADAFAHVLERERIQEDRETLILELEARNAEMQRFTYTVSHDLKSPLITIEGFLGYLQQDLAAGNMQSVESDMARIQSAAQKMKALLDDLLKLSRIGRLVNPPKLVDLNTLIQEALQLTDGQTKARCVRVSVSSDLPRVCVDALRITEVFQNLIDNAVKFMGEQPVPRIDIGAEMIDDMVTCYVRDNGIGIPARYHEKIFGLFEQLDQNAFGTGIGLALVKRIIEVHQGRIWVESAGVGLGTTFYFTLPHRE